MIGIALVAAALSTVVNAWGDQTINWKNTTGTSSETFPTDVGVLGDAAIGQSPFNAQYDRFSSDKVELVYAIDMRHKPKNADQDQATTDDIYKNLGTYTPWRPADGLFPETEAHRMMPEHCEVKQVHILHRNGATYPEDAPNEGLPKLMKKLVKGIRDNQIHPKNELSFLNNWDYKLGQALLVHQGAQELFDSGVKHYYDYAKLLTDHKKPVVRTTSHSSMLDSARYWTLGFFGWDAPDKVNLEVLLDADRQNNTLEPAKACENAYKHSKGDDLVSEWQNVYLQDARHRLQRSLDGYSLSVSDVSQFMSLCAYETAGFGFSNFCHLFTKEEWEGFQYQSDLQQQGNEGFMSPTAKARGLGWVQEFLRRVTKKPFKGPVASKNMTIDNNETYFPLNQPVYADFTRDSVITNILTAFGFTQFAKPLKGNKLDSSRTFRSNKVVPFASRIVFEILDCHKGEGKGEYVRVKVNDAVLPLGHDQGCKESKDGLCQLNDFVQHLESCVDTYDFDGACCNNKA